MARFRKKPVEIEAVQFPGVSVENVDALTAFEDWFKERGGKGWLARGRLYVATLEDGPDREAKHVADPGDWIIRGVQGEFYPCKPDIFEATYEKVA